MRAIVLILFSHWVADFVLQRDRWAREKWHSNVALLKHVGTYTLALFALVALPFVTRHDLRLVAAWALVNGTLHLGTDWISSRFVHRFFEKKDYHNGFVVIGLDQFIHTVCLLVTWEYMA